MELQAYTGNTGLVPVPIYNSYSATGNNTTGATAGYPIVYDENGCPYTAYYQTYPCYGWQAMPYYQNGGSSLQGFYSKMPDLNVPYSPGSQSNEQAHLTESEQTGSQSQQDGETDGDSGADSGNQVIPKRLPGKKFQKDKAVLKHTFKQSPNQDLPKVSRVSRRWSSLAAAKLKTITHLKLVAPFHRDSPFWPCMHLPTSTPCSQEQYFCTTLYPYNPVSKEFPLYDEQIDQIMEHLDINTLSQIDISDCPRVPAALSYLLTRFGANLQSLSLNRVSCLKDFSFTVWRAINLYLPMLKKLALVQLGTMTNDMPVLQQLDEFHLATTQKTDPEFVTSLLLQLGDGLRKLALNLPFPSLCLEEWQKECPTIVAGVTHLELCLRSLEFNFAVVSKSFVSLTHLTLILPSRKAVFVKVLKQLPKMRQLQFLELTEGMRFPKDRLMAALNEATIKPMPSIKTLHLEVCLENISEAACLSRLFPNVSQIAFRNLGSDSFCACPANVKKSYRVFMSECDDCCSSLKKLLIDMPNVTSVLGVEPDAYYEAQYPMEKWCKCRYKWM